MDEFIKVLLSLSFSGTLLLLLLFLLKQLYKNKFSKRWQYYIWLVAALRFLLPVTLDNNTMTITGYLMEKINIIKSKDDTMKIKQEEIKIEKSDSLGEIESNARNTIMQKEDNYQKDEIKLVDFLISIPWYFYLFFLWLVFALVLFLRKVLLYQRFVHYIQAENMEVSEVEILNLLADCEEMIGISKPVELYYNPLITSPIMIGFFHPKIILSTKYKKEEMFYIFLHELIHYKHRDIFYKWFIQIVTCVHWFNPFVYLLEKEINQACELSCDEAVLCLLGDERKKEYGDVLILALKTASNYKNSYVSITFVENVEQIKERLGAIMDFKKKTTLIKAITTALTVAICVSFTAVGVYASGNKIVSKTTKETKKEESKKSKKNVYVYMQEGFFRNSYVIEMGWNINAGSKKSAAGKANITLRDKSEITIYFNKETKKYAEDKKALTAIKEIINDLKSSDSEIYPVIKEPYICRIDYVRLDKISEFAENCYKERDITGFYSVFPELDSKLQKEYYKKAYKQNKIDFFSCIIENMDNDTMKSYIEKAFQDEDVAFFSVLLDELSSKDIDVKQLIQKYIKYSYETDDFAFFSILLDYLSAQEKQKWLEKADKDRNKAVYHITSNSIKDADEELFSNEYEDYGIIANGDVYYYKEKRIRIFQDMRPDKSFVKSFIDSQGSIDIRILRDDNGKIKKVKRISKKKANKILKDLLD